MNLYLDEDSSEKALAEMLKAAGYDVLRTQEAGKISAADPLQLVHAIQTNRIFLTRNHTDFENLKLLLETAAGHHPGILVICRGKNPKDKMKNFEIVRAISNLANSGTPIADQLHILNHWN